MDQQSRNDLIRQYADGPNVLRSAWMDVPGEAQQWRPARTEWSAHEIIVHCADSETYAATRIRLLVAEPNPLIVGYDQEHWAITFDYHRQSIEDAFDVVSSVRRHTSLFIQGLTDSDWAATGTHTESGSYSALDWLRTYAAHLHDHASQIRSNIAAWQDMRPE